MKATRALLPVLLFFLCASAWADPGLSIVPDGPVVRGKITTVSVFGVGDDVKKLWDLSFSVSLNEYLVSKAGFAGPKGATLLQPGARIVNDDPIISGPKADGDPIMKNHPFAGQKSGSGGDFKVFLAKTVFQPGELFRISLYVPIDFDASKMGIRNNVVPALFSGIEAHDQSGNTITVSLDYRTVTVDLRKYGDVNNDNSVNQGDAIRILQAIVGLRPLSPTEAWYADVQPASTTGVPMDSLRYLGNSTVNLGDAMRVLMYLVGLWDAFWWPDKPKAPACDPSDPSCAPACDPNDPACSNPPPPPPPP
jgi:hypothetical protein